MNRGRFTIEWFNPTEHYVSKAVNCLRKYGFVVNYHDNLRGDDIKRLKEEIVDRIVTELSWSPESLIDLPKDVFPEKAGVHLLRELSGPDSANKDTIKIAYTVSGRIDLIDGQYSEWRGILPATELVSPRDIARNVLLPFGGIISRDTGSSKLYFLL